MLHDSYTKIFEKFSYKLRRTDVMTSFFAWFWAENWASANMMTFKEPVFFLRSENVVTLPRTNPDSLRSCLCFRVFRLSFASDFFDLLFFRFHQGIVLLWSILSKDASKRLGWELNRKTIKPCTHGRSKNDTTKEAYQPGLRTQT